MRIFTILALLICWTAAEASSKKTPKLEVNTVEGWVVAKDGEILRTSGPENLADLFHEAPIALLNADGRPLGDVHDILEDMRVMTSALGQLIADAFPDNPHVQHVGIRSYYLGNGCLFLADLPFHVAGAEAQSPDQPSDEAWDAARRKLGYAARAAVPPDRVERLKETLRSALALAKNIRHFNKADEFIAVAAVGRTRPPIKSILTASASFKDLSAVQFAAEWTGSPSTQGDSAALARVMDKLLRAELGNRFSGGPIEVTVEGNSTRITSAVGVPVGEGVRSLYLKGYGALFFTDVHYQVGKNEADNELPADLWQESLRELRSGPQTDPVTALHRALLGTDSIPTAHEAVFLRGRTADTVLEALRYGSRIGGMDPDEALIVSIRGYKGSSLVFRTLKRHADAYGGGALDIDAFREKVSIEIDMRPLSWEALMPSPAPPAETLTLTINEDGGMRLNGAAVTMEQLKLIFLNAPEDEIKKKTLIVEASPKASHTLVIDAGKVAHQVGFQEVNLAVTATEKPIDDAMTLLISAPAPGAEYGAMTLDGKGATMEQLKERFNNAPAEKKKSLIIRSSPKALHEQIMEAANLAKQADFQNVGFKIETGQPIIKKGDGK